MSIAFTAPVSLARRSAKVHADACRPEVVEKLLGFLEAKIKDGGVDKAKALLWRCAAEGRGIGPIGTLTSKEVRIAVEKFEDQEESSSRHVCTY